MSAKRVTTAQHKALYLLSVATRTSSDRCRVYVAAKLTNGKIGEGSLSAQTIRALRRRGWVCYSVNERPLHWQLTDAGRRALDDSEGVAS